MNLSKKTIILASITGALLLLIIILLLIKPNKKIPLNKLKDDTLFFEINSLINDKLKSTNNETYSYMTTDIYYKETEKIIVYFTKGYVLHYEPDLTFSDNVYYLLKNKGASYEVTILDNVTDLKEYANNYEITDDIISSPLIPTTIYMKDYKEKYKLSYYISIFLTELNNKPSEAFNRLTEEQKQKYQDINDFQNNKTYIIKTLSADISSYKKEEKNNKNIYTITITTTSTDNTITYNTITIYENSTMDFTIDY